MSCVGLAFSLIYVLMTVVSIAVAFKPSWDAKSRFMYLQGPIVVQLALLDVLVRHLSVKVPLEKISWFWAYVLLWLPTVWLFYCLGWLIERLFILLV